MLTAHMLPLRVNVVRVGGLFHMYINLFKLVKQDQVVGDVIDESFAREGEYAFNFKQDVV